jgi:hypothetical protein
MINYSKLQTTTKNALLNAGAVPLTVRLSETNTTVSTVGVFVNGLAKNIDNRQNPTWVTGETALMVMVPGIDFYNVGTNTTTTPQVGGTVEWTQNMVSYKKVITEVAMEQPIPNTPILFTLKIA